MSYSVKSPDGHSGVFQFLKSRGRKFETGRKIFQWLRYQYNKGTLRSFIHQLRAGNITTKIKIQKFLQGDGPKYLQVGGGFHLKNEVGWINGDIIAGDIYLDAMRKLPFPDCSLDVIFTEQFIEHIPQAGAKFFMEEAYRTLKVGGVIRQSTPQLEKLISIYRDENSCVSREAVVDRHLDRHRRGVNHIIATGCQFINDQFSLWGHQFIYDRDALIRLTEDAGFEAITWCEFGKSDHPNLVNLERHADTEWMKSEISMFCEATKKA